MALAHYWAMYLPAKQADVLPASLKNTLPKSEPVSLPASRMLQHCKLHGSTGVTCRLPGVDGEVVGSIHFQRNGLACEHRQGSVDTS